MRFVRICAAVWVLVHVAHAQNARDIVRRSVEQDQANWLRMQDYTWIAQLTERHFDSAGKVTSTERKKWETIVLSGQPYRRTLEHDGKPLTTAEERKQQEKFDRATAKLERESPDERRRRLEHDATERRKEREFLLEIPDAYDFHLEAPAAIDGRAVWVIDASPHPGYQPKHSDAKAFSKIRGRIWIDQAEYQWVRLEAQTIETISFGLFLARLNPGARLEFDETRVNDELWLPKREYVSGTGRIGIFRKVAMDQELTWTQYRKFRVESTIVPTRP